ncbi:MAG: ACP S-malonyltransferase [Phycisphaeraceae bacterium]|nr:ACP S-malonyltransferase [Phycisphaeraceae bacterium]
MTARLVLCPGQGAQTVGMAQAWLEASEAARAVFDRAEAQLGDRLGSPIRRICSEGPETTLNRTDVCQPAIFVASIACWHGLLESWGMSEADAQVSATAGLSLGEYTALHMAGAISFEDALELVVLRGRAMQDAAEAIPSGMVALTGADESQAREVCDAARGSDVLVCANLNAPGQVVLSGGADACARAASAAQNMGLRATPLAVAGAFHSPLMQPAADRLRTALDRTTIVRPRCTVLANVSGEPHSNDPDEIRRRLVEQLTWPVRWSACCQWLAANAPDGQWHELAPGRTLSGLMRRISRDVKVTNHDQP